MIVTEDDFGLRLRQPLKLLQRRFDFMTRPQKIAAFKEWLAEQEALGLLQVTGGTQWSDEYIESAYKKGAERAYVQANKAKLLEPSTIFAATQEQFVRTAFFQPETLQKVQLLNTRAFDQLKGISAAMDQQLSRIFSEGLVNGYGPEKIARNIDNAIARIDRTRARALARTECLVGETLVDAAMVRAAFRRWYDGPVVEIKTGNGAQFTATPNHPMLTQNGWVAAGMLDQSHYLICDNRQKDSRSSGDKNVNTSPSTVAEIFDSLAAVAICERETTAKPDFHGDGVNGYVDILRPDGQLPIGSFAPISKPLAELIFAPAAFRDACFCPFCRRLLSVDQQVCLCMCPDTIAVSTKSTLNSAPTDAIVFGYRRQGLAGSVPDSNNFDRQVADEIVIGASLLPRQKLGIRTISANACLSQNFADLFLIRANSSRDLSLCHPRQIKLDNVFSTFVRPFSGHVYNLQTKSGYFTIGSTSRAFTGNTIHAHAEGQLDSFKRLGIDEVHAETEVLTAGDERVCIQCSELEGQRFKVDEAHGIIPVHVNCRCCWIPVPGSGRKRGRA